jgi:hypothetical protein
VDTDKVSNVENAKVEPGAVVLIIGSDEKKETQAAFSVASEGAAAALMLTRDNDLKRFDNASENLPRLPDRLKEEPAPEMNVNVLELNKESFHVLMRRVPCCTSTLRRQRQGVAPGTPWACCAGAIHPCGERRFCFRLTSIISELEHQSTATTFTTAPTMMPRAQPQFWK